MSQTHTIVVQFPDGMSPEYSPATEIQGGRLVAVSFDGNRLTIEQELEEALRELVFLCEQELADPEDVTEMSRARAALARAQGVEP